MIKNFFKNQRGVNLISLSIAVIIILVLTNAILYNVKSNLGVKKLQNMQTDIENLRDKISVLYAQNGKIPASVEYNNINHIEEAGLISHKIDTGKFFVIDLASIDNLTLNYGEDYKKIKSGEVTTSEQINNLNDLYIINETSHNIFYVKGIKYDNELFYTDYTSKEIDTKAVNLVDINSIESWSPKYNETAIYKDENGDIATIPAGFKVSRKVGENIIENGLVICDEEQNEFVWIPVDKMSFYNKFKRMEGYYNGSLQSYIMMSGESGVDGNNSYLKENNLDESETTKNESKLMYESVKKYGGFYIARFEAGKEIKDGVEKIVSKKNVDVYANNIPWSSSNIMNIDTGGAVEIARKMSIINKYSSVTSTLCYGVQWDAALNFIDKNYISEETTEGKPNCNGMSYLVNSTGKGWYIDNQGSGNITHKTGIDIDNVASNKLKNIYDMAGNVSEWTMESYGTGKRVIRGGSFLDNGSEYSISSRKELEPNSIEGGCGFRVTLYLNM